MSKIKYPKELKPWAAKIGVTIEDLRAEYEQELATVQANHPELDEEKQIHRAKVILYSRVKAINRSSAVAFGLIPIGLSGVRDMNTRRRNTLMEMYMNPSTRDNALTGDGSARVKVLLNQETGEETPIVIDTRDWIKFTRDGEERTFKNRGFGKELPVLPVRDIIAVGSLADEADETKILRISSMRNIAETYPQLGYPMKVRLNAREENEYTRDLRTAAITRWGVPTVVTGLEDATLWEEDSMYNFLGTVPEWMQTTIDDLEDWHGIHEDDFGRAVVIEADVTYVAREPNSNGNYLLVIEDTSKMDLEAEGVTCFAPGELESALQFGNGSHVRILGRTGMGQAYDRETRQPKVDFNDEGEEVPVMRVLLNVLNIVCDPDGKVPYEEGMTEEPDDVEPE